MSIQAENNKKTEYIKISLGVLLEVLEKKKQMVAASKSNIYIDDKILPHAPEIN